MPVFSDTHWLLLISLQSCKASVISLSVYVRRLNLGGNFNLGSLIAIPNILLEATEVSACGCVDSGIGDGAMGEDKYMVIVVDDVKEFAKELNEAADDNWGYIVFK